MQKISCCFKSSCCRLQKISRGERVRGFLHAARADELRCGSRRPHLARAERAVFRER